MLGSPIKDSNNCSSRPYERQNERSQAGVRAAAAQLRGTKLPLHRAHNAWRTSFQERIPDHNRRSLCGGARGRARGCECLAWQSKSNSNAALGEMSCGDKRMPKSHASALQKLRQWAHASTSFFCIQEDPSSLSELITEPLVSGTK